MLLLAIESSCDETAAAVLRDDVVLSNVISSQLQHAEYGGVIPELASRLHQQQVVRVVQQALADAQVPESELEAIAYTNGPGLLGALLVGASFAKAYAWGLGIPTVPVNHMEAHVLANFLMPTKPQFPMLCLTVSGGHTQLVLVRSLDSLEIIGETIDDAAGEAFDKAAKLLGLPYPGGPQIDKLASTGNPKAFKFPTPSVEGLNFSFSGIKTSLLYLVRDGMAQNSSFIETHKADVCASYQGKIVDILLEKLERAADLHGVQDLAIAGGVSANRELRSRFLALCERRGWRAVVPDFAYCTDNAAMIGVVGWIKAQAGLFGDLEEVPFTRA